MAATQLPYDGRLPQPGDIARIVVIDLVEGQASFVAETRGWDVQLGAQPQWGDSDETLYFNDVDPQTWTPFGVRLNPLTQECWRLDGTVYSIAPDGRTAASPCLRRIALTQPGYGVVVPKEHIPTNLPGCPAEHDGIYVTDTATGRSRLLVSLALIVREAGIAPPDDPRGTYYAFHVKWNARGDRLMLVLRCVSRAGGLTSTLVTLNADGTDIRAAVSWKSDAGNHPN